MDTFAKCLKLPEDDKKETILKKIRYWWYKLTRQTWFERNIEFPIKDFRRGVLNLFTWLPIVWKDRNWDSHYILDVLKFKIKNTRDYILKANRIADYHQERINRYCTLSIKLIDLVSEERYEMEYLDYFDSEFNWDPIDIEGEPHFKLDIKELGDRKEMFFKKYPLIYKQVLNECKDNKEIDVKWIAHLMSRKNHERAKKLLFKILEQELPYWWD